MESIGVLATRKIEVASTFVEKTKGEARDVMRNKGRGLVLWRRLLIFVHKEK